MTLFQKPPLSMATTMTKGKKRQVSPSPRLFIKKIKASLLRGKPWPIPHGRQAVVSVHLP
jgi:hypothetical protein